MDSNIASVGMVVAITSIILQVFAYMRHLEIVAHFQWMISFWKDQADSAEAEFAEPRSKVRSLCVEDSE